MEAPSAIVVGHSFVKRLTHWIGSQHAMAPNHPLELCDELKELTFLGKSGLYASQLHESDLLFQAGKHDIVIVDCGTNDLANDLHVSQIVHHVFLFARRCLLEGASIVVLLSVLPRTKRIATTSENFRACSVAFNEALRNICRTEKRIMFYRQTGFTKLIDNTTDQPVFHWSNDGIHPSPHRRQPEAKSGMEKYCQSIKTALHRAYHRYRHVPKLSEGPH